MAGAQCLLPAAVAPVPAQSQLAKEKQGGAGRVCLESSENGGWGGAQRGWVLGLEGRIEVKD